MKIKFICLLYLFFYWQNGFGDHVTMRLIPELNATLYTIQTLEDTITFIKTDTNSVCKKPTLLFCQGSLPIPLIVQYENRWYQFSCFNFDYRKLSEKYNLIVVSMPHVPSVVSDTELNPDGTYPCLPKSFDAAYKQDNYLEKYVQRANQVIHYILSQSWADSDSLYIIGHSQGATIGVSIARTNEKVKGLAYLSGDPDGRFTQKIKRIRKLLYQSKVTPQEAQQQLNELYDWWRDVCSEKQEEGDIGDLSHTWKSFSRPMRETLVHLKIPLFIAYGTEDIAASGCELMPIYFELNGKTDYMIYPVIGCGHNFEEFTNGQSDWGKMHWQEVIDRFIQYIETQK